MAYRVDLTPAAERNLDRLPRDVQERVVPALMALENEPRPRDCKKLKPPLDGYRIRIGDYRVLYVVDDSAHLVAITKIAARDRAY
jgi:mRNA interferase RelE/StbE